MKPNYKIKGYIEVIAAEDYEGLKNLKDKQLIRFDSFTNAHSFETKFMEYYTPGKTPAAIKNFSMDMMHSDDRGQNKPLDHGKEACLAVKNKDYPIVEKYMEQFRIKN
jgi:hypothetical protein